MRAREPDARGTVDCDGVRIGYEVFGSGDPAVMLMPTWTIIHSRFWKLQVPHLARRHRVITWDGPGNGRSDRSLDPEAYTDDSYARYAKAVLDAVDVDRVVAVGLSRGAGYSVRLAAVYPQRVAGLVLIGAALPLAAPPPARAGIRDWFFEPYPDEPQGWDKYNVAYWHDHYADFAEFFFGECFPEPHSTKPIEDTIGWASETSPAVLEAEAMSAEPPESWAEMLSQLTCPILVVHGTEDRIMSHATGQRAAELSGGRLLTMAGSGHIPNVREPARFNRELSGFLAEIADAAHRSSESTGVSETRDRGTDTAVPEPHHVWTRGMSRAKRVLYLSSPIGLGHARRDLAIAKELRAIAPDVEIDWLAQDPVTSVLEADGEAVHPASDWLGSESGHIASEANGHDLNCFQALRRMDEILVANFMVFQEVVEEGMYDLVIGDEAWDVDHFWHENPELKRGSHVWLTDFVGFLPMPDGGEREAFLTADYNAEMIGHIERYPRIRDRAIFVGNPDDVIPETFGHGLPKIRDWTEQHFDFSGYITGFEPPTEPERGAWRAELGYRPDERLCIVTVGGSGVGSDLLELAITAFPQAKRAIPGLRMVVVAGPRIDPTRFEPVDGLEIHGYVDRLYRHLAVCDLAVVQGGLTTTMELTAAKRPFISFPLGHHFEQSFHVRHRLSQYGAGRHMDHTQTDRDALAEAITVEIDRSVSYRDVETDGARRAAEMIAAHI